VNCRPYNLNGSTFTNPIVSPPIGTFSLSLKQPSCLVGLRKPLRPELLGRLLPKFNPIFQVGQADGSATKSINRPGNDVGESS
jgi:hypothetical protein